MVGFVDHGRRFNTSRKSYIYIGIIPSPLPTSVPVYLNHMTKNPRRKHGGCFNMKGKGWQGMKIPKSHWELEILGGTL